MKTGENRRGKCTRVFEAIQAIGRWNSDFNLSGFGAVDDSDILRFVPTSTGSTTAGTWSWYFDGSDIFVCTPGSLGSTTTCTWAMYWDGSVNGFSGEDTDSLSVIQ